MCQHDMIGDVGTKGHRIGPGAREIGTENMQASGRSSIKSYVPDVPTSPVFASPTVID